MELSRMLIAHRISRTYFQNEKLLTFHYNSYPRIRARPLSLKEVLQLRDGMKSSTTEPYQIKKIANDKKILLALN